MVESSESSFEDAIDPAFPKPFSDAEENKINFLIDDDVKEMTFGRRIGEWKYPDFGIFTLLYPFWLVLSYDSALTLIDKGWYYPQAANQEATTKGPSLEKAWAYFEHFTLPRYLVTGDAKERDKAEPGNDEKPTR